MKKIIVMTLVLGLALLLVPYVSAFKGSCTFSFVPDVPDSDNGVWEDIYDPTPTLNYTEPAGAVNYRTVVATPGGGPWTKIRVLYAAETVKVTDTLTASVCIRNASTDDCTAAPTQILFSTSASTSISTNSTILSDVISFSFNSADTLLVNTYTAGGEGRYLWVGTGSAYYSTGSDETMTQTVTYTADPHVWNFELIEGWNPD